MDVVLDDWSLKRGSDDRIHAKAGGKDFTLDLDFTATQPVLLQGDNGYSRKGPLPAQASHYYSLPHLTVSGTVQRGGKPMPVKGTAWLDREWSSSYLDPRAVGWDWVGLNLDDGGAVMAFQIRDALGRALWAGGSFRNANGETTRFAPEDVSFTTMRSWHSPRTATDYPVERVLTLRLPAGARQWRITPLFDDQELDSRAAGGPVYWEGAARVPGGRGYLELTGYFKPLKMSLTMNKDLGLSPAVFGFGAGIFFLGYLIFQVPANLILEKIGARRWMFIILAVWGLISAANAFMTGPYSYYALRLLLGVAEAGFFPGMLLYMTYWFPHSWRGRFVGIFMAAIPLANIIGGPLSTTILGMDGIAGLHGWQWMFILEGLPASLLAVVALKLLPDRPASASWLTAEEKKTIAARLKSEEGQDHREFWPALRDPRVIALGLVLLGNQIGLYGVQLWLPQIVQDMGFSNFATGFVVALCFIAGNDRDDPLGPAQRRQGRAHLACGDSAAAWGLRARFRGGRAVQFPGTALARRRAGRNACL